MKQEDMQLMLNYLKDKEDLNDELKNLLERLELVCKQILVQANFQKDMEELNEKIEKLK